MPFGTFFLPLANMCDIICIKIKNDGGKFMKKLCLILITVMLSSFLNVYAADATKFENKDEINIVYLGGSITLGSGAALEKSWRALVGDWFTETYPGTTVNNFNAGIHGTGSELGYYRTRKDVIDRKADIVFIEFAVNDFYKKEEEGNKLLEAIVNALQKSPTNPYIIFVYTTKEEYKDVSEYQEKLAQYYGIPSIDLQTGVVEPYVATGGDIREILADGTHPNVAGYQKYADYIISCLETGEYFKKPLVKEVSYVESQLGVEPYKFTMPRFTAAYDSSVKATGDWGMGHHYAYGNYYKTTQPGATLEFKFSGPILGMMTQRSKQCGQIKMELDGETIIRDEYYPTSSYIISNYDNKNLKDEEHTLKITVLDSKNEDCTSETPEIMIYGFFSSDAPDSIGKVDVSNEKITKLNDDESSENGNMKVVEADVKNFKSTAVDAISVLTVYDGNGKLVGVNQVKKTFATDKKENFEISAIVPDEENAGCKLFMWDNNSTLIYASSILK